MRLVTFINNWHTPQLYQDHLNSLDCLPIAENLIYNIQLQLRNADFKNICSMCRCSKTYYKLLSVSVMNIAINNKAKKQQCTVFWLCSSDSGSFIRNIIKIWRSTYSAEFKKYLFFWGNLILHKAVRFLLQFKKHLPKLSQINNKNRTSSLLFAKPTSRKNFTRVRLWETERCMPGIRTIIISSYEGLTRLRKYFLFWFLRSKWDSIK